MRVLKKTCGLGIIALLASCGTVQQTTIKSKTGVQRVQRFSIPESEFNATANEQYEKALAIALYEGTLNADSVLTARVKKVAAKVIAKAKYFRPNAAAWFWQVNVINDDELNAICYPGGKIIVYSGLLRRLQLTDDELGQILGHEIAHALREHSREQASREKVSKIGVGVLGVVGPLAGLQAVAALAGLGADLGFNLPFSREHETEADHLGIELAARAGYNPDAAVSLWKKMIRTEGGKTLQILSTHPLPENREADLRVYAEKVRPLYEAARKK